MGPSSPTNIIPQLLNLYGSANYKVISGYRGLGKIMLAMEKGEAQVMVGSWVSFKTSFASRVKAGKVKILVQMAPTRHRELTDVPTTAEVALTPEGKAFAATVKDPVFLGEIRKRNLDINSADHTVLEKIVADTLGTAPAVIAKAAEIAQKGKKARK